MSDKMQTRQYTEFQFVAGTTGKTLTVHDADVAQWLQDIIEDRDELVQMGALDGRELLKRAERAEARVAELETELRRALAIAPSNAIAWQDRAIGAELERDQYRHERDAYRDAMARMNAPAIALAALQPPPPIIMPAQNWELHQQIQTLNERIAYLEPIFIAARNLVDNAEEYECDGLGLWAQHGWWEPLHDALDPDGSAATDDIRQPVAPAK